MPDVIELSDADFAFQMQGLSQEAEAEIALVSRHAPAPAEPEPALPAPAAAPEPPQPTAPAPSLSEVLRPLVQGVQAMGRTSGEHALILSRLDRSTAESTEAQKELPKVVADLRAMVDQRNSISRQMFDALHEELKSYKDGFLLDTVHRPMIRDLITLYDDLSHIHQQMRAPIESAHVALQGHETSGDLGSRLESVSLHLEHNLDFILEVLARLEVARMAQGSGRLNKQTQRAVAVEAAEDPDEDMMVVRTVKRGFLWKERVVRAEEVVIKKWKEGFLMALKPMGD
ncbi:MAG TPA: nucleotide exchange factor GrpE [Chthoniobacteraceae bacterium]|jgi:molecular chaperone GrpE (heat shock protein)|nr:nucleotide exchange factor GrpE [Chthoniobacteraceae bacterium]